MVLDLYSLQRGALGLEDAYEITVLDPRGREIYFYSSVDLYELMDNIITFVDSYKNGQK